MSLKFKALYVIGCIALSACSNIDNDIFLTNKLPEASLNQEYYAEIKMQEQAIIQDMFYVETDLHEDSGLKVSANQGNRVAHSITVIEGIPQRAGKYNIHISGVARSGQKNFDKNFILIVKD